MPNNHALLSPSSSHRWLHCTPSVMLEAGFENKTSQAAEEGTAAHALCEHKLKKILKMRSKRPVSSFDNDEMEENSDAYVEFVQEQIASCDDPLVLVEQRVDFSDYVPDGFGTADCLIVSDGVLHIIDYKNGAGVLVEIKDNPQLKCYALGGLSMFDGIYDISEVRMSIFQPRRENVGAWTMTAAELKAWGENILKPKALLAIKGEGECNPGEWCVFCRAAVKCRARAEQHLKLAQKEFRLPPVLSDDEIENILSDIPGLTKWANEIMAYATDAAVNHGKEWNGFKVVEGRSMRRYLDEEKVADTAVKNGFIDIYRKSLISLTEMEKLMGKVKFGSIMGGLICKPPGKPSLVPITDKQPAMNLTNAKSEFEEE